MSRNSDSAAGERGRCKEKTQKLHWLPRRTNCGVLIETDMQTAEEKIIEKTKELCQTIVEQPEFKEIRRRIDSFMADDTAKMQYQQVAEKHEMLQHKQQMGATLNNDEVMAFEKDRQALESNPVARGFMEAQQQMHQFQQTVNQLMSKTFELGRIPTDDDLEGGSCGSGCGCHH